MNLAKPTKGIGTPRCTRLRVGNAGSMSMEPGTEAGNLVHVRKRDGGEGSRCKWSSTDGGKTEPSRAGPSGGTIDPEHAEDRVDVDAPK